MEIKKGEIWKNERCVIEIIHIESHLRMIWDEEHQANISTKEVVIDNVVGMIILKMHRTVMRGTAHNYDIEDLSAFGFSRVEDGEFDADRILTKKLLT